MNDDDKMYFGTHSGKRLGDIPLSYWKWIAGEDWLEEQDEELFDYACERIERDK